MRKYYCNAKIYIIYYITYIRTDSREYRSSEVKRSGKLPLLSGLVRF